MHFSVRRLLLALVCFFATSTGLVAAEMPRLVVVVSVDQFPARYLSLFRDQWQPDGAFQQFDQKGAWFINCHHRHAVTITAPGHACMLTGADPNRHGIIANSWYDRETGKNVNCVEDPSSPAVGSTSPGEAVSPRNLLAPTLGDNIKLSTEGKGKVFGVSWKDRAGVLMSGHAADASYWFDGSTGGWITSQYYRKDLPGYIRNYNEEGAAQAFGGKAWELSLDPAKYHLYVPDDNPYEMNPPVFGNKFPHQLTPATHPKYYDALSITPFANQLTIGAAQRLIEFEKLGQDEYPDLICIGLSANDYVGHAFGPHSLEVQEITIQTDRQLAELFRFIDEQLKGAPWTFALSSDHGVGPIPELAVKFKLPGARNPLGDLASLKPRLEERLQRELGTPAEGRSYVDRVEPGIVYLNVSIPELAADRCAQAQQIVRAALLEMPPIAAAHTRAELLAANSGNGLFEQFRLMLHPRRSGEVLWVLAPYSILGSSTATHGSPWQYDSHVPLVFMGAGIKPGKYSTRVSPAHMGPTLARVLGVDPPAAAAVDPAAEAIE
jgi:hypothetical protein